MKIVASVMMGLASLVSLGLAQDPPQYGTPFAGVPDPRDAAIYQVNIRAFSEGGNFQGVTRRLDQIAALGVNVLYLMPHTPVGILKGVNSPYCVRDYKAVNAEFGNLDDLRTLVSEAHKRGMAVLLDWVANHTAWDHPWITAHPDWYERDGNGEIKPAQVNNFVWKDVAKLDFGKAEMRRAMVDALRYWIFAVNCDGFRFDYSDGPPIDFWLEVKNNLRAIPGRKVILYAEGGRFSNYQAFDWNHGFSFYDGLKQMFGQQQETALKVEGENNYHYQQSTSMNRIVRYVTNHDVNGWDGPPQRLLGGQAATEAAFVLAAYNHGVPLFYNGQEIALDYALEFPFTQQKIAWTENPGVTGTYTRILRFRAASEALRRGHPVSHSIKDVSAFVKQSGSEKVLVIVNIRNRNVTFPVPQAIAGTWHDAFDRTARNLGGSLELRPFQYLVLSAAPIGVGARARSGRAALPGIRIQALAGGLELAGLPPATRVEIRDLAGRLAFRGSTDRMAAPLRVDGLSRGTWLAHLTPPVGPSRRSMAILP